MNLDVVVGEISAGAYRWPVRDALRLAVTAIKAAPASSVDEVRMVLFDEATRRLADA